MKLIDSNSENTALELPRAQHLARIKSNARRLLERDKADNTLVQYASAWRNFNEFCRKWHATSLPASAETVAAYIADLALTQSLSTIRVKLSAVGYYHRKAKEKDPTVTFGVTSMMDGVARDKGEAPAGKDALALDDLRLMVALLPPTLRGCRDRAILLLGFAGAFRRSEITALDVSDLQFSPDALTVRIRRSKTDQAGKGNTKVIPRLDDELDPARAVQTWLAAAGVIAGPVFRPVDRWDHLLSRRLCAQMVRLIVQRSARAAGIEKDLAAHSLRSGFVTAGAEAGVPMDDIRKVTLHKTFETLKRYDRAQAVGQVRAIKRVFGETE